MGNIINEIINEGRFYNNTTDTFVKHQKRKKVEGSLLVSFLIIYGF
jgi:hypothetical protein